MLRDGLDRGERLAVVHAGRAEHADGTGDLAVDACTARRRSSSRAARRSGSRSRCARWVPWSSRSWTSDTTSTWCSSSSSSRAALVGGGERLLVGGEPAGAAHVERLDDLLLGAGGEGVARLARRGCRRPGRPPARSSGSAVPARAGRAGCRAARRRWRWWRRRVSSATWRTHFSTLPFDRIASASTSDGCSVHQLHAAHGGGVDVRARPPPRCACSPGRAAGWSRGAGPRAPGAPTGRG